MNKKYNSMINQNYISHNVNVNNSFANNSVNNYSHMLSNEEKPVYRPTTPLSYISSTSNSQIIQFDKKSVSKAVGGNMRKKSTHVSERIKAFENTSDVFKKRDKLPRTPPRLD